MFSTEVSFGYEDFAPDVEDAVLTMSSQTFMSESVNAVEKREPATTRGLVNRWTLIKSTCWLQRIEKCNLPYSSQRGFSGNFWNTPGSATDYAKSVTKVGLYMMLAATVKWLWTDQVGWYYTKKFQVVKACIVWVQCCLEDEWYFLYMWFITIMRMHSVSCVHGYSALGQ